MVKVSEQPGERGDPPVLRVEGRLVGAWVPELQRVAEERLTAGAAMALDLTGLEFADGAGAALLRALRDRGVSLVGPSPFVALLVDRARP
jgi:anti-anti-sigma regulatory factor